MDKFIVIRKKNPYTITFNIYPSSGYIGSFDSLEQAQKAIKDSADDGKYIIYKATEVSELTVEIERKVFSYTKEEING